MAALEKLVTEEFEKTSVEGVRYSVALRPIFEQRQLLKDNAACMNVRGEILFKFTGGSGFNGKVPYFVKDSLDLLSAMCGNPSLVSGDQ